MMSREAHTVLVNAVPRAGAKVRIGGRIRQELTDLGLISAAGNLTNKGVQARQKALDAALEGAF